MFVQMTCYEFHRPMKFSMFYILFCISIHPVPDLLWNRAVARWVECALTSWESANLSQRQNGQKHSPVWASLSHARSMTAQCVYIVSPLGSANAPAEFVWLFWLFAVLFTYVQRVISHRYSSLFFQFWTSCTLNTPPWTACRLEIILKLN